MNREQATSSSRRCQRIPDPLTKRVFHHIVCDRSQLTSGNAGTDSSGFAFADYGEQAREERRSRRRPAGYGRGITLPAAIVEGGTATRVKVVRQVWRSTLTRPAVPRIWHR